MCWTPCRGVWCGTCYAQHPLDRFYRFTPSGEDGFDWRPAEEQSRYTHGRNGDHLLTPFQCDLCVFHNLKCRNPLSEDSTDQLLLCCIRWANLDAVWGGEPHTVQATFRAVSQITSQPRHVGLEPGLHLCFRVISEYPSMARTSAPIVGYVTLLRRLNSAPHLPCREFTRQQ
jgi:hypothetical protein